MNILIITQKIDKNDSILGFFHRWVEEFAKHYKEVTIICLEEGKHDLPENVVVKSLGKEKGGCRFIYFLRFYKYILGKLFSREKPQHIFIHMNEIYVLLLIPLLPVRKILGVKLLWWKTHGHLGKLSRSMRFFVDKILTASIESFPINMNKKIVVGHGIDTKQFCFSEENTRNDNLIMAVGRYSPSKRYEDLINAAFLLKNEIPDLKIFIFGAENLKSGKYKNKLGKLIERKGLQEIVELKSPVRHKEMTSQYQNAGIIVNTSNTDSLDKVVLEAMACGTIPISSNFAYQKMLKPYGLDVKKRETKELAEKIKKVFSLPENKKMQLRKEMRDKVVIEHNLSKLIKNIYSL